MYIVTIETQNRHKRSKIIKMLAKKLFQIFLALSASLTLIARSQEVAPPNIDELIQRFNKENGIKTQEPVNDDYGLATYAKSRT